MTYFSKCYALSSVTCHIPEWNTDLSVLYQSQDGVFLNKHKFLKSWEGSGCNAEIHGVFHMYSNMECP